MSSHSLNEVIPAWLRRATPLQEAWRKSGRMVVAAQAAAVVATGTAPPPPPSPPPPKTERPRAMAYSSLFTFNTDGSNFGNLSKSHQAKTASGIGNGSEILGYTIPLDSTLKRIKKGDDGLPVARVKQAAILTFTAGACIARLLCVGNDTGGRHNNGNKYDRTWGELGVNTYQALSQFIGFPITIHRNGLTAPPNMRVTYEFLAERISNIDEYRALKAKLTAEGRL